jgi:heme/copper-type cytochrome/quinol oxidase subunit 4
VLLIGPAIAVIICLLIEDRSDPNWFVVVAVCTIGWLVSTIVGSVYWRLRTTKGRPDELDLP